MKTNTITRTLPVLAGVALLASSAYLHAAPVSLDTAQNVARNWMTLKTGKHFDIKEPSRLAAPISEGQEAAYRIIQLSPKGWVIVSADDVARPIIGYGESAIDPTSLPPAFSAWMRGIDREIKLAASTEKHADTEALSASSSFQSEWDYLKQNTEFFEVNGSSQLLGAGTYVIPPLLWLGGNDENSGIHWDQGQYYNAKTPFDPQGQDNHALTGCVATAMGQVMRYYQSPQTGTGSYSYDCSTTNRTIFPQGFQHDYGVQSANFGATTYDWNLMPIELNNGSTPAQIDAVSTLLYQAGVSVAMNYGTGQGDGGSLSYYYYPGKPSAEIALKTYFGYSQATYKERVTQGTNGQVQVNYTWDEWESMLKETLDAHDPILYAGTGTGGHAFVLDGYANDGTYHFNWGFGGQANGQYQITSLTPRGMGYDFSNNQQAIFLKGVTDNSNHNNNNNGVGGGCTYNPQNRGMDIVMILMILLAALYPMGRRYLR